jgi:hypothetical protein
VEGLVMSLLLARIAQAHRNIGPNWQDTVLSLEPFSFCRFKEASGAVAIDISGNAHDGAYVGNPVRGAGSLVLSDANGKSFTTSSGPNAATIPCLAGQPGYTHILCGAMGSSKYGTSPVVTRWPNNGRYYMLNTSIPTVSGNNIVDSLSAPLVDNLPHIHILRTNTATNKFTLATDVTGGFKTGWTDASPNSASVGYNYGFNEGPIGNFGESATWGRYLTDEEVFQLIMAWRGETVNSSSPVARYWRMYCTAKQNTDGYMNLISMAFRATPGGYCHGFQSEITTSQSSVYQSYDAHTALKGNGFWHSNSQAAPWWAAVDFGRPVPVAELMMQGANVVGRQPKDFKIQSSDDGSTWIDRATYTGVTGWDLTTQRRFSVP